MLIFVVGSTSAHHETARAAARVGHKVVFIGEPCGGLVEDLRSAKPSMGQNVHRCDLAGEYPFQNMVLDSVLRVPDAFAVPVLVWGGGRMLGEQSAMAQRHDEFVAIMAEYMGTPLCVWKKFHDAQVKSRRPYHQVTLAHQTSDAHPVRAGMRAAQVEFARNLERELTTFLPGSRSTIATIRPDISPLNVFDECVSPILAA